MRGYILDCCTLLNLYCGWGGIRELSSVLGPWTIGQRALSEAQYARDFAGDGIIKAIPLGPESILEQHAISVFSVESDSEIELFVEMANRLDDGEAECIALAAERSLTLCTDERLAQNEAAARGIEIATTPQILEAWASASPSRREQLPSIVSRIEILARFTPHRSSPHLDWWRSQRIDAQKFIGE